MKVIFLDVDGVLNNQRSYRKRAKLQREKGIDFIPLEDFMFKHLKTLVDETGAKIVLSSSWRYDLIDYKDSPENGKEWIHTLIQKFKEFDIPYDMARTPIKGSFHRGSEIGSWIFHYMEENSETDPIESFVILDDDCDMQPFGQFFVQTSFLEGLRANHVRRAKYILANYKFDPKRYETQVNDVGTYFVKQKAKG